MQPFANLDVDAIAGFLIASLAWADDYEDPLPARQIAYETIAYQISCWSNRHPLGCGTNGASDVLEHLSLGNPESRKDRTLQQWVVLLNQLLGE